ncbi:MAG: amino acid adenylation domain-containing protein, partial [Verrucomicrobia bacterium]|nr:amino acid adenylation domain-containing protein [Verrucomicrobiota bacterium]
PVEFPRGRTLSAWFETQVERTPDVTAVTLGGTSLSYRELNARANRLARHLRKLGLRPDGPVGMYLDRSLEMIVGLLGILKAGGAYVPLDPVYPRERLAFMLEDARVSVLLTTAAMEGNLPPHAARIIRLDADWPAIEAEWKDNLPPVAGPDHAAYVIYTSGSTGQPKGCVVTHYQVVRLFEATQAWFQFDASDVWTLFHSYAFDFSVWELWGALLYGGRLVVVPFEVSRAPDSFLELLRVERVTVLNQTPSAFRQLMAADEFAPREAAPLALRWVVFGGEALDVAGLRPWFDRHGDSQPQLVNMYGITETTVHVTWRRILRVDCDGGRSVIGVPIPDLQLHLLDAFQQPVPIGVAGEMYVGGAGVARGYLRRPELTAQRFVPDPFSGRPGAVLYRSGDLARRLPNGDVEYLGRIDHQVKIRGFRIELGEIEAALASHPAVGQSLVLLRGDPSGEKRLVGYVVSRNGTLAIAELREHLRQRVPDYMVPAAIVVLEAFPLTPNGKIDRRALPAPEAARSSGEAAPSAPVGEIETAIARLWCEALGVERVGRDENFFDIGGHSLLVVQVHRRVRAELGHDVSVVDLFKYSTVRALAEFVQNRGGAAPTAAAVVAEAAERARRQKEARRRRRPGGDPA